MILEERPDDDRPQAETPPAAAPELRPPFDQSKTGDALGATPPVNGPRPEPLERRPQHRRRSVVLVGAATLVVFAVAFAVGRSQSTGTPTGANASNPVIGGLAGLVVQPRDTTSALTVRGLAGGNQVDGQPTLDLCNGSFPSESLRVARLQDVALDGAGQPVLSTEAVEYRDAAATAQAFSELKRIAATCPSAPVESPIGEPTVTTKFGPRPDRNWPETPSVNRVAFTFTTADASGQSHPSIAVYLRRDRLLVGVYFSQPDGAQPAINGRTTIEGIVNDFAVRLAKAPLPAEHA